MEDIFKIGDYVMRPLGEVELKQVFCWRNSVRIHEMMLTDHVISWNEHATWFERARLQKPCRNFIFCYKDTPIGYIGYTEFDAEIKSCSPGAYIGDMAKADLASGLFLMFMTMDYAFSVLRMETLETRVFSKNKQALGIDRFIGYTEIKGEDREYKKAGVPEKALLLRLEERTWSKRRKSLLNMMGKQ